MHSRFDWAIRTAALAAFAVTFAGCATTSAPSTAPTACARNAVTGFLRPEAVMSKRCFDQIDIAHSRMIGAGLDQQVASIQSKAARLISEMDAYAGAKGSRVNVMSVRARNAGTLIVEALEIGDALVVANRILLARDADAKAGYDPTRRRPNDIAPNYNRQTYRTQQRAARNLYRVRAAALQQIDQNRRLYVALKTRANGLAAQADPRCNPI